MTRAERKAAGLCNDCNSPAVAGLVRCARHREMARIAAADWQRLHPRAATGYRRRLRAAEAIAAMRAPVTDRLDDIEVACDVGDWQ